MDTHADAAKAASASAAEGFPPDMHGDVEHVGDLKGPSKPLAFPSAAPRLLAHRGGKLEYDENTMSAFKACYEKGLRGFETDFQMTSDGRLVILHDEGLDRTTDGRGALAEMTADEILNVRTKQTRQPLPFVEDFVAYFKDKPDVFIELEMKTDNNLVDRVGGGGALCSRIRENARRLQSSGRRTGTPCAGRCAAEREDGTPGPQRADFPMFGGDPSGVRGAAGSDRRRHRPGCRRDGGGCCGDR